MTEQNKNNGNKDQESAKPENLRELMQAYWTDRAAYMAAVEYHKVQQILEEFYNYFKNKNYELNSFEEIGKEEAVEYYCYLLKKYQRNEKKIKECVVELNRFILFADKDCLFGKYE